MINILKIFIFSRDFFVWLFVLCSILKKERKKKKGKMKKTFLSRINSAIRGDKWDTDSGNNKRKPFNSLKHPNNINLKSSPTDSLYRNYIRYIWWNSSFFWFSFESFKFCFFGFSFKTHIIIFIYKLHRELTIEYMATRYLKLSHLFSNFSRLSLLHALFIHVD